MVKESLKKFIKKYPYFLTREPSSVFYRTSDVNNRQIQRLYCDLYDVYQSFHLNKRLLIWKTQEKPYDYNINFVANYDNLKHIQIFKEDDLINEVEFDELGVNNYEWTYTAEYVQRNIIEVKAYKCSECGTIYFDDTLPVECSCGNNQYIPLSVYKCSECDELYFLETLDNSVNNRDCSKNNHSNTLEEVHIYKCRKCGEIYFEKDELTECSNCYEEDDSNLGEYHITATPVEDMSEEYGAIVTVEVYNSENVLVDTVTLNEENGWEAYTVPLPIYDLAVEEEVYTPVSDNLNYTVVIGDYVKHKTPSTTSITPPIYYNTDGVELVDNRQMVSSPVGLDYISYDEYLYLLNNGRIHIMGRRTDVLADGESLEEIDSNTSLIVNPNSAVNTFDVNIINNVTHKVVDTITLTPLKLTENGDIIFTPSEEWIFPFTPTWETYSKILPITTNTGEAISYSLEYDNPYFDVQIIDHNPLTTDFTVTYDEVVNNTDATDEDIDDEEGEDFQLEIPMIPYDKFSIRVETYEEYVLEKGFPENDYSLLDYNRALKEESMESDIYDHDYSLDEIGALNNIPRKNYELITDPLLYPYTEPPYNNRETEDDYHYMNRMLEYNTRMWWMNPVSLELWKLYGVESELINRERYLLKVFDETRHPFNEETELVECWSPRAWEHKDKFCDGSKSLGEYFFVYTSSVRPIVDEDVTCYFHIVNMLGEPLPYNDYTISIDKIITVSDLITDKMRELQGIPTLYDGYKEGDIYPLQKDITDTKYIIESEYLSEYDDDDISGTDFEFDYETEESTHQATNIFSFKCFKPNGEQLGYDSAKSPEENERYNRNYIVINVRAYDDSDWFVNPKPPLYMDENTGEVREGYVGKGTEQQPFLTLEEAISKVTPGLDLIGLADDITIKKPVLVDRNCTIIGQNSKITTIDMDTGLEVTKRKVPRIFQHNVDKVNDKYVYDRKFFKISGNKSNTLTLSNLRLVSGEINNYININTWQNNNPNGNLLNVYVHGGGVLITISLDNNTYYPYDFVTGTVKLTKSDGETPIVNNNVELYYKGNLVYTYTTDIDGEFRFLFNLQEYIQGEYTLIFKNKSDNFFEIETGKIIDAVNPFTSPKIYLYQGESVSLISADHEISEGTVNYYSDVNGQLNSLPINNDGESTLANYKPVFGRYIIYTTYDNQPNTLVRDEWYVESKVDVSRLYEYMQEKNLGNTLITNLVFDASTGLIEYDTVDLAQILQEKEGLVLGDLDNILTDVRISKDDLIVEHFHTPLSMVDDEVITYMDAKELENAILDISFTDDGVLTATRLGEFWRRKESSITLTSSSNTVDYTDQWSFTGQLSRTGEVCDIDIFLDNTYIDTVQTDTNGEFIYTTNTLTIGDHTIRCEWSGDRVYDYCKATVNVSVKNNKKITLTRTGSTGDVILHSTFTVTGRVTESGVPLENREVLIYDQNNLLTSTPLITDSNGEFTYSITPTVDNYYKLYSKLVDEEYDDIISSPVVKVTARRKYVYITLNGTGSIYYSQSATFNGDVTDEFGDKVSNAQVVLSENGYDKATTRTDSNGHYTFPPRQYNTVDTIAVSVRVMGGASYNGSYHTNDSDKNLVMNKAPTTTSLQITKNTYETGEIIPVTVNSNYGNFNPESVIVHYIDYNHNYTETTSVLTSKNGNGAFEFTIPKGDGYHLIYSEFTGDENYSSSKSQGGTYGWSGARANEITIENALVDTVTLSIVNGNIFRVNFKKNGTNVSNTLIDSFLIKNISGAWNGTNFLIEDKTTDVNGNIDVRVDLLPRVDGSAYVEYGALQSNTITY